MVSEPDLRIQQASENVRDWLNVEARQLLGNRCRPCCRSRRIQAGLPALQDGDHNPFHLSDVQLTLPGAGDLLGADGAPAPGAS